MYFAVAQLTLDLDSTTRTDEKALKALCDSIRSRFKISVAARNSVKKAETQIALAMLGPTEEAITKNLNEIARYCEESGYARVIDEQCLLDHIDTIDE